MNDENPIPVKRRGIGTTLPVGWKHMSPPSEAVKNKIFQQIMERVKKEQLASAQRAARAEERKNEKEKSVWLKQQIEDCVRKIETVNSRKTELDDLKSRLFAQLKEVVAKDKAQKATLVSQQQQTNPAVAPTQSSSNKDKQDSSSAQSIELSPADDNNNNSNDSTANTTANNSQQMDDGHMKHNNNNLIYFYIDNTPFDGIKLSLMFMMYLFKCNKPRFASPSVKNLYGCLKICLPEGRSNNEDDNADTVSLSQYIAPNTNKASDCALKSTYEQQLFSWINEYCSGSSCEATHHFKHHKVMDFIKRS